MSDLKRVSKVVREAVDRSLPEVGEWYWVWGEGYDDLQKKTRKFKYLAAVVHVGSNYVKLEAPQGKEWRVHLDQFDELCEPELQAKAYVQRRIAERQENVTALLGEVKLLTAKLSVSLTAASEAEAQALAVRGSTQPVEDYKAALVKAKDTTLPELFKKIEREHEAMAMWMKADLIPLKAQADQMKPLIKRVEDKIFNVELYAGLTEQVKQVRDGKPADADHPIHLFQRRAYMDEECLADYRAGGMEFHDIAEFDHWMAQPENFERLLPFPRALLAMRVRRFTKDRSDVNISPWVRTEIEKADKRTFLYMRNGEQLYRLSTGIEFEAQLFPDVDQSVLDRDEIWAKVDWGKVEELRTKAHYEQGLAAWEAELAEYEAEKAEWARKNAALKAAGKTRNEILDEIGLEPHYPWDRFEADKWHRWSPEDVYYDDITAYVRKQIDQHNRVVLVLQGLLDRSPVFHPHPKWELWTPDGFTAALRLVHDASRALVSGDPPSYEAFRDRLNAQLKAGSIATGQRDYWLEQEATKENRRQARDWRIRNKSDYKRYEPYGDPGPGLLDTVEKVTAKGAVFTWTRPRKRETYWGPKDDIKCSVTVPLGRLLNVSAYTAGDFKPFFADPRTRADYLQWAMYLLPAEDYHGGYGTVAPKDTPFECYDALVEVVSISPEGHKHTHSYSGRNEDRHAK